jgi:bleomycin hydrolase
MGNRYSTTRKESSLQKQSFAKSDQPMPPPIYSRQPTNTSDSTDVPSQHELNKSLGPSDALARTVLMNSSPKSVLASRHAFVADTHVFSNEIKIEGNVTNQKSSGRCWIFAATNILRLPLMKKYDLESFELSQKYVFC